MIPLGGMLIGTALGVVAEVATTEAASKRMEPSARMVIAVGFGLIAGLGLAYALSAHQSEAASKGQLTS